MTAATTGAPPVLPAELTADPDKRAWYTEDTYLQESLGQLRTLTDDASSFARRHAVLLCKPDAVLARRLTPAIDWLEHNGFQIVSARRITLTRHVVRALWYFQWNIASPERRRCADRLVAAADSLVLVVRGPEQDEPASVLLTERKGPTDPARREPGQLRHLLGRYSYLLNLVHTPDEPADVLRELGVYFAETERADVFVEALSGRDRGTEARELAELICAHAEPRSLRFHDAAAVLAQEVDALLAGGTLGATARGELAEAHTLLATDRGAGCAALLSVAWRHRLPLDDWSVVVAGSYVLPMKQPSAVPLLHGGSVERWRRHFALSPAPRTNSPIHPPTVR